MTSRERIKQRFDAVFPSLMEAGEQPVAGAIVMSGPNIWLIGPLLQRWYFIEVTDRRVLFINCSKATPSPKGLAWADPRDSVQVHDVAMDYHMYGKFRYRRSNGEDIPIKVDRFWREDGQAVVAALTSDPQHAADGDAV